MELPAFAAPAAAMVMAATITAMIAAAVIVRLTLGLLLHAAAEIHEAAAAIFSTPVFLGLGVAKASLAKAAIAAEAPVVWRPVGESAAIRCPVLEAAIAAIVEAAPIKTRPPKIAPRRKAAAIVPAAMEAVALVEIQAQRRTDAAVMPPGRMRPAPFVIMPAAMQPVLPAAIPVTVIDRAVIPGAAEKDRAVINRQVPEIVGATPGIAIAARVIREADAARRWIIAVIRIVSPS